MTAQTAVLPDFLPQHVRLSLAGAQHKLLVAYDPARDALAEPEGGRPSTHLLKPDHPDRDAYPHSVINEFFTMTLAGRVGLPVPPVWRRYVPHPVYLVQRFDREESAAGDVARRHIIDACQLLNRASLFKYSAGLDDLLAVVARCRGRLATRQRLCEDLEMLRTKKAERPWRKHGNIPL